MNNDNHLNAALVRCGSCHYWRGERRIEFINHIARRIYCSVEAPCPRQYGNLRNCRQNPCQYYRKWIELP